MGDRDDQGIPSRFWADWLRSLLVDVDALAPVMPALLAAARGTTVLFEGDAMGQASSWLGLLVAFNAIHWSLSGLLFGRVVESP